MEATSSSAWPVVATALIGAAATLGGVWFSLRQASTDAAEQRRHDDLARDRTFAHEHAQSLIQQRRIAYEDVLIAMDELNFLIASAGEVNYPAMEKFIKSIERARLIASSQMEPHIEALFRASAPMLANKPEEAGKLISAARPGFFQAARKDLGV